MEVYSAVVVYGVHEQQCLAQRNRHREQCWWAGAGMLLLLWSSQSSRGSSNIYTRPPRAWSPPSSSFVGNTGRVYRPSTLLVSSTRGCRHGRISVTLSSERGAERTETFLGAAARHSRYSDGDARDDRGNFLFDGFLEDISQAFSWKARKLLLALWPALAPR